MSDQPNADRERDDGALFWTGTVLGWAIIAFGLKLLFDDPEASWFNTLRLTAIGIVAHDIVWLAVSVGGTWLVMRALGRDIPHWIRWATWTSAIVIAMWFPLWRGYGDRIRNDTILPRDYRASIIILLIAIWLGGAAAALVARRRQLSDG
ncbi:MAG: hypothetical protein HKN44_10970 [Ilumatobacter sp.]|nr:hypothetical protein [Ilumatobacter sp.]